MIAVVTGNALMSLNNHNQAKELLNEKYYENILTVSHDDVML